MRLVRTILTLALSAACLVSFQAQAMVEGPGGTGGGDTDAVKFIARAVDIGNWLKKNAKLFKVEELQRYNNTLDVLVAEMGSNHQAPIRFVESPFIVDANGVNKMAVFVKSPLAIVVSRPAWRALNPEEQYQLVALEMFGLSDFDVRYEIAGLIHASMDELFDQSGPASAITEKVKVIEDFCTLQNSIFPDKALKKCTRITASQSSISISTTCQARNIFLVATVSSPLLKKGEYFRATSRVRDEQTKEDVTCMASIEDYNDQSGFFMISSGNNNGYWLQFGSSGKAVKF